MRALSFEIDGRATYGLVSVDGIREVSDRFWQQYPDLRAVLTANALSELPAGCTDTAIDERDVRFLPLIPNPDKIICVGVNYRPHLEEMGREATEHPLLFVRFAGSQVGHKEPIVKPSVSDRFDFEGEIAVVVGRRARNVARSEAADYLAGYTCFMDGTARDWQRHTSQFTPGKNFHHSGALGPFLTTPDELRAPGETTLETRVNGEVMQQGSLKDLIFDVAALIAYCSTFTELLPGDVIATGTPGGVGAARQPPIWLKAGDRVEVDIADVGCLENTIRAE